VADEETWVARGLGKTRMALALLCVASYMAVVDTTIVSIALPSIRHRFDRRRRSRHVDDRTDLADLLHDLRATAWLAGAGNLGCRFARPCRDDLGGTRGSFAVSGRLARPLHLLLRIRLWVSGSSRRDPVGPLQHAPALRHTLAKAQGSTSENRGIDDNCHHLRSRQYGNGDR
jgi:hypothetical protein